MIVSAGGNAGCVTDFDATNGDLVGCWQISDADSNVLLMSIPTACITVDRVIAGRGRDVTHDIAGGVEFGSLVMGMLC